MNSEDRIIGLIDELADAKTKLAIAEAELKRLRGLQRAWDEHVRGYTCPHCGYMLLTEHAVASRDGAE